MPATLSKMSSLLNSDWNLQRGHSQKKLTKKDPTLSALSGGRKVVQSNNKNRPTARNRGKGVSPKPEKTSSQRRCHPTHNYGASTLNYGSSSVNKSLSFMTLMTAVLFLVPGAMATTSSTAPPAILPLPQPLAGNAGDTTNIIHCTQQNEQIQNQLSYCQSNLTARAYSLGECIGIQKSQCNIALTEIDETTSQTFCENKVATSKTASQQICTPTANNLNSCQQSSHQMQETLQHCHQNLTALQLDNQALKLNQEQCRQDQEQCRQDQEQDQEQCLQDQGQSLSLQAEFEQFQTQFQEQFQQQKQEQKQSIGLGLGLGGIGAALVGAGALAGGYACGKHKGRKEGYENALKQMNKMSEFGERRMLNQVDQVLRRSLNNSRQHSPAISRHSYNSVTHI